MSTDVHKHLFRQKALFVALSLTLSASMAWAENPPDKVPSSTVHSTPSKDVEKLSPVTVTARHLEQGQTVIDRALIEALPNRTGTLTDVLRGQTFIAFDRQSEVAGKGAEIAAPLISINGSRPFENNFSIDGISNNNTLNPGSWSEQAKAEYLDPTGDSASLMLQTDLLDTINVFSENVSARYGDFMGGVVDAQLRDAKNDGWHGSVAVRHTDSDWARQHFTDGDRYDLAVQKDYRRTLYSATLEGPIQKDRLGAMLVVSRHTSRADRRISMQQPEAQRVARRSNDNVMLRVNTLGNDDTKLTGTFIYAPYEAKDYIEDARDSAYTLNGGGLTGQIKLEKRLDLGQWDTSVGLSRTEVSRDSDHNVMYNWNNEIDGKPSDYANWFALGTQCREGGFGDSERRQDALTLRSEINFEPLSFGITEHRFLAGIQAEHDHVKYDREGSSTFFVSFMDSERHENVKGDLTDGIVAGEQFARERMDELGINTTINATTASVYLQDDIQIERVHLRPGMRMSWDNISHNVDIAPRFMADIDVLNDDRFNLNAGWNRYYGKQIIGNYFASKMYDVQTYRRNMELMQMPFGAMPVPTPLDPSGVPDAWELQEDKDRLLRQFGELKTPYADEITLGASANIFNGLELGIKGVKREYKNQLSVERYGKDGYDSIVTNNGRRQYKGITFSLARRFDLGLFGQHAGQLSLTRAKIKGTDSSMLTGWDDVGRENVDPDYVLIDGVKTARTNIPVTNFNPKWSLAYMHSANFMHDRLRTTWLFTMRDKSDQLEQARPTVENGMESFDHVIQPRSYTLDLDAEYDVYKHGDTTVTLALQVTNLLDRTTITYRPHRPKQSQRAYYQMGRQFYAGLKATF